MSINLFNEIAASGDNTLDPGRVPLECLSRDPITSLIFRIRSSVLL
jgi:hypothetical protein